MGGCLLLVVLSWTVIRLVSVTAAVVLSAVALGIPPFAAIVANAGREGGPFPPADRADGAEPGPHGRRRPPSG